MKYTIEGFNQSYALTLKKEVAVRNKIVTKQIDCTDLVILRWFVDFYPNMKKIEVDGKQYAWLTHSKLQKDLPIIDISKRSFIDRMQKLVEFEILDYRLLKEGGTFSLYGFGKNYINLVASDGTHSNNIGDDVQDAEGMQSNNIGVVQSNNIGCAVQTANKDNSIIDSSFNNKSNNIYKDVDNEIQELFNSYTTDEEVLELFLDWLDVRKQKRLAKTTRAIKENLNKLDEYAYKSNMSVVEYLKEVVRRSWGAFYVVPSYGKGGNSGYNNISQGARDRENKHGLHTGVEHGANNPSDSKASGLCEVGPATQRFREAFSVDDDEFDVDAFFGIK